MSQLLLMLKHWQNYDVPKKKKQNKQTTNNTRRNTKKNEEAEKKGHRKGRQNIEKQTTEENLTDQNPDWPVNSSTWTLKT